MSTFRDSRIAANCAGNEAKITGGDDNKSFTPRLVGNWLATDTPTEFETPKLLTGGSIKSQGIASLAACENQTTGMKVPPVNC